MESSAGEYPLRDLAVNQLHHFRELPRKEKLGGQIAPSTHNGLVLPSFIDSPSFCRLRGSTNSTGGELAIRQLEEVCGSEIQMNESLLQQEALQAGVEQSAAVGVAQHFSETACPSVVRLLNSEVRMDQLRQASEAETLEHTVSRPPEITLAKTSSSLRCTGDNLDGALREETGVADSKGLIVHEITVNQSEIIPPMLWQDFDEDGFREIDRLCVRREKIVCSSEAEKKPLACEGIQPSQRNSDLEACRGLLQQNSYMPGHSAVFYAEGERRPQTSDTSSKTGEGPEHQNCLVDGLESAQNKGKEIHDGIHETDSEICVFSEELLDFFEYGISPASPTAT